MIAKRYPADCSPIVFLAQSPYLANCEKMHNTYGTGGVLMGFLYNNPVRALLVVLSLALGSLPLNAGGFNKRLDYNTSFTPSSVVIGDFNEDGKSDVALLDFYGHIGILLGN